MLPGFFSSHAAGVFQQPCCQGFSAAMLPGFSVAMLPGFFGSHAAGVFQQPCCRGFSAAMLPGFFGSHAAGVFNRQQAVGVFD